MKLGRNATRPLAGAFVALVAAFALAVASAAADDTPVDPCTLNPCPSASIAPTATTGEGGAAEFTVTLSSTSLTPVTVHYATADGTAQGGSDYSGTTDGTIVIDPLTSTGTISVPTIGDATDEPDETFSVTLTGADGATIPSDGSETGVATITDDDPAPTLSISGPGAAHTEGDSGNTNANFTVTLTGATEKTVSVDYSTGAASPDYTTTSGTLTFSPGGSTSQTVPVPVVGDQIDEDDQTLTVTLSNESNATLTNTSADATIADDDAPPVLAISGPASVTEPESDPVNASFTVTLTGATEKTVTVNYTTGGDATAGSDYTATSGLLTFAPGDAPKTIDVPVLADTADEPNESLSVTLATPSNATINTGSASTTIVDSDDPPAVSVADAAAVDEGNSGAANTRFTATLSKPSGKTVTVGYATANGSAAAGSDYDSRSGTLAFAPGQTSMTVDVPVNGDGAVEPDEDFFLDLSVPGNATIGASRGRALIRNDDAAAKQDAAAPSIVPVLDRIAPRMSKLALSNRQFRVGKGPTVVAARAKVGTAFRYALTEPATVSIIIDSAKPGQTVRKRCVAPKKTRRARRCTRYSFVGAITRRSVAGLNVVPFSGRIGRKALKPGTYRARLIASDDANNRSPIAKTSFTVVK